MKAFEELREMIESVEDGKPYHCALCLQGFDEHEDKALHMQNAHGYEILRLTDAGI